MHSKQVEQLTKCLFDKLNQMKLSEKLLLVAFDLLYCSEDLATRQTVERPATLRHTLDAIERIVSTNRPTNNERARVESNDEASDDATGEHFAPPFAQQSVRDELTVLMNTLALAKRRNFKHLATRLCNLIADQTTHKTISTIYRLACKLELEPERSSSKLLLLSWLPLAQHLSNFRELPVELIVELLSFEDADIDRESKLNALSSWWSQNRSSDVTNLWISLSKSNKTAEASLQRVASKYASNLSSSLNLPMTSPATTAARSSDARTAASGGVRASDATSAS